MLKQLLTIFSAILVCGCVGSIQLPARNTYASALEMMAHNKEGLDYSREVYFRGSGVAVLAIHGGDIESDTSRLARRVAGGDFNLYIFNGWLGAGSGRLHVTATRFDDPDAVRLATSSVLGISIHEQLDRGSWVCVGGGNAAAAALTAKRLEEAGFSAAVPCERLPGKSPANIVNRASAGGVQLELTPRLLSALERNEEEMVRFSDAVRRAALEFVSTTGSKP